MFCYHPTSEWFSLRWIVSHNSIIFHFSVFIDERKNRKSFMFFSSPFHYCFFLLSISINFNCELWIRKRDLDYKVWTVGKSVLKLKTKRQISNQIWNLFSSCVSTSFHWTFEFHKLLLLLFLFGSEKSQNSIVMAFEIRLKWRKKEKSPKNVHIIPWALLTICLLFAHMQRNK